MSHWPERRNIELAAVIAWAIALAAAVLLGDSTAPFITVLWTGLCVGLAYQVLTRRWWTAIALAVVGAWSVLYTLTGGSHSPLGRAATAIQLPLVAFFLIAVALDRRRRHRA
jgi:hypothetical protein